MAAERKLLNISTSEIPVLDTTIGNPSAYNDPKSNASMASSIQAIGDQAQADRLYDSPPPPREGFRSFQPGDRTPILSYRVPDGPNCYNANRNSVNAEVCGLGLPPPTTWIQRQLACQKPNPDLTLLEGFQGSINPIPPNPGAYALLAAGAALLLCVFIGSK